jgi:hypothetical protein
MSDSAPITWFTENPAPIIIAGIVALFVLGGIFLKSGRSVILLGMAGVALFMALAILIDHLVVTDRESVEQVLYQGATAAERNDLNAVVGFISPSAAAVRTEAQHWIGQVVIESINIGGLEVTVDRKTNPPTATAHLWFLGKGKLKRGDTIHENFPGRLTINFQREGDRWLVTAYELDH